MSIPDLIAAANERLTPKERRIAEAVLDDPTLLAFGTVSNLASQVGTSRPTIVRFATKLGFRGYTDLQTHVRQGLSQQLSRPSQRIRHQQDPSPTSAIELALATVQSAMAQGKIEALAPPIAHARSVWILSGETSRAGAHTLHSGLTMIRGDVHFVNEHSSARDLGNATPTDVAVFFDFARYRRHSTNAARTLAASGIPIVAITDGPLSPLAALTDTWCELTIPAIGPFDSSIPAVATAELLVAAVAHILHDRARDHIDRTEALWKANDTFLME